MAAESEDVGKYTYQLFTDGACFGNPGPMGIGVVMIRSDGKRLEFSRAKGIGTNNQAEYLAVIAGLKNARALGIQSIDVRTDSQLVVKQLSREWEVRDDILIDLWEKAIALLDQFQDYDINHIPRTQNRDADRLSREGAGKSKKMYKAFLESQQLKASR